MQDTTTYVLVVGGSLVGSSAALFLASQGVPTILVERHAGSSPHPRAIGYTPRTLEVLRAHGLSDSIPEVPASFRLTRARVESLSGTWFEQSEWTPDKAEQGPEIEHSPCGGAAIAQDRLEPILREKARERGADLRMSTELISFDQDAQGVTARVRQRDGLEYTIRAAYLVAADGGKSKLREALGIAVIGRGHMRTVRSVLFRAPLSSYLERGVSQFEIDQPDFKAFLTTYNDGRWILMLSDDVERDDRALRGAIARAIGRDDLPIELITTGRWELGAVVAERFSQGRVFLAGDAAHCLPPTRGGYGANTGIHDAHNLAWKLAAVYEGRSQPALLDTYSAERQPVAWVRHQQIFARADYKAHALPGALIEPIIDDVAMELGQLYRSTIVLADTRSLPLALRPEEWAGQPGTRAPHLWLERGGARISSLDLFQSGWVLLSEDARWGDAAAAVSSALALTVQGVVVGRDVEAQDIAAYRRAFGVTATGATLVRPDGYVAWRAAELAPQPTAALLEALARASLANHARRELGDDPGVLPVIV